MNFPIPVNLMVEELNQEQNLEFDSTIVVIPKLPEYIRFDDDIVVINIITAPHLPGEPTHYILSKTKEELQHLLDSQTRIIFKSGIQVYNVFQYNSNALLGDTFLVLQSIENNEISILEFVVTDSELGLIGSIIQEAYYELPQSGIPLSDLSEDVQSAINGAVLYNDRQPLTASQQETARRNIDAQATLTFDESPQENSENPVTSDGIFNAFEQVYDTIKTDCIKFGDGNYLININKYQNLDNYYLSLTPVQICDLIISQAKVFFTDAENKVYNIVYFDGAAENNHEFLRLAYVNGNYVEIYSFLTDLNGRTSIGTKTTTTAYIKPNNGIPKGDLETSIQSSLDKADQAVKFTYQQLTDAQKEMARNNIGAFGNDRDVMRYTDEVVIVSIRGGLAPLYKYYLSCTDIQLKGWMNSQTKVRFEYTDCPCEVKFYNRDASSVYGDTLIVLECEVLDQIYTFTFSYAGGTLNGTLETSAYYTLPSTGIPEADLSAEVQSSLNFANDAVQFVPQTLTSAEQAQARANIGAASISDLGIVFNIKGEVEYVSDLPESNNHIGDVYYVSSEQVGYVWLETEEHPNGYWEQLGPSIDLSGYATLASPAFTGIPTAPTPSTGTSTSQLATAQFVQSEQKIFPVIGEVTPYSEIIAALNAGKIPVVYYDEYMYYYVCHFNNIIEFSFVSDANRNAVQFLTVNSSDEWDSNSIDWNDFITGTTTSSVIQNSGSLITSGGVYSAINNFYTKPSTGIPASDLAEGVIPTPLVGQASDATAANYVTPSDVISALEAGKDVIVTKQYIDPNTQAYFGDLTFNAWTLLEDQIGTAVIADMAIHNNGVSYSYSLKGENNTWTLTLVTSSLGPEAATASPVNLAINATVGSSLKYAREDHAHAMPSASDIGAVSTTGNAYRTASIPMGAVDSTSTATAFTATVDGITELRDGVCVWLRNGVVKSAAGCTLNINNLGAKPIYISTSETSAVSTTFAVAYTMLFIYNSTRVTGGCWDMVYGYNSDTNTIGYQLRTNSTKLPMVQKVYRYRLLFTSADGTKWVGANTSTSTNATASRTPNQTPINPFGKIVYYGYTSAIDAGSMPGATYMWTQYVVTLGYSFNNTGAALTLEANKPIYLKCAPQSDGSAIIDATTPYVQALPSTADGKIYIFLGITIDATTFELINEHPIYCYRNGGIQKWTGVQSEIDGITIPSTLSSFTNDVGFITSSAIPSNVSAFTNDAGYVTSSAIPVVPVAASTLPAALGSAAIGSSADYARADHVHAMPSASDVNAFEIPATVPSTDAIWMYTTSNSAWGANTLAIWSGGSY